MAAGNHVTDPFRGWDMNVRHPYCYLWPPMGNDSRDVLPEGLNVTAGPDAR